MMTVLICLVVFVWLLEAGFEYYLNYRPSNKPESQLTSVTNSTTLSWEDSPRERLRANTR